MSQPVLGILTLYLNNRKRLEEVPVYERMITEGRELGLDVFVFTPADVNSSQGLIHALQFNPDTGSWTRRWRPFPHMIYDRCRIQKSERFQQLLRFRSRYRHLLFLNRPLRNKWTVHQTLSGLKRFRPHLPDTMLVSSIGDVNRMLGKHHAVYLKPINGTGGRGILRISKSIGVHGSYEIRGRNTNRSIITPKRLPAAMLSSFLSGWDIKGRYLVQEGIPLELPSGRVHDYRMLVQKNGFGEWEVTGCVGRVGAINSVTSNLHGGGRATGMNELLDEWIPEIQKREKVREDSAMLGVDVSRYLEEKYGALCELALDLAVDKSGRILLLEVNPKPSREVFSQVGDKDAYRVSLIRPLEYALWVYNSRIIRRTPKTATE
ncbi:Glutathione synthase/RimK-type ligase, ATP-grasp superfamily [Paenibacillus uliginis N3/975]|uniref:Glutathione synthase/RimK-type ligase, ATP-grasp superfamily n=1 Tax=Paenibacillus uliginis N3/975 TaxID=1313296 RepID=A0A1X7GZR9_9BACL|nr:YheC/YheD family protein [Paenibacillus uliginis]SMF76505.1 Glutathione synthase/RimK-type ligase, ATP-grasp superfamily [Paenibacillus uliginis N3/975]